MGILKEMQSGGLITLETIVGQQEDSQVLEDGQILIKAFDDLPSFWPLRRTQDQ